MKNSDDLLSDPEKYFEEQQRQQFANETTLTKRERFAMAAMQGLISMPNLKDDIAIAPTAVKLADETLNELEKTQ